MNNYKKIMIAFIFMFSSHIQSSIDPKIKRDDFRLPEQIPVQGVLTQGVLVKVPSDACAMLGFCLGAIFIGCFLGCDTLPHFIDKSYDKTLDIMDRCANKAAIKMRIGLMLFNRGVWLAGPMVVGFKVGHALDKKRLANKRE